MESEAALAIRTIERFKNPEGTDFAGQLIVLLEWEKDYLRKLLDTKAEDGRTRYEQSLLFLPKKQGKTTFIAALALYFLIKRKHGQIKALAQVKEQAAILYKFIASMIRQDEYLSQRGVCRVYKGNIKKIECYESDSTLEVLSSDAVGANGLNASILLYDEICFSESSELWDAVISGGINRENLLAIGLSTAGDSTSGFGYAFYERAKAILANPELDPTFLPVIYEAPKNPDWQNVQTYLDCSPTFREIGDAAIRRIRSMIEAAKKDPSQLRRILRYHLNQWVGADAKEPWIPIDRWDACKGETLLETLDGAPCDAGLDLASVSDLTALALLFPPHGERKNFVSILKFYMPAETLASKERSDAGAQYTAWQRAGLITATPGDWTDYNYIIMDLLALKVRYQIRGIAIDRAYNAAHLSQALIADGHNVVPTGQGTMTVCPAARELETLVVQRRLEHGGNEVLRWNVSNCIAKVVDDVGNIRPSKAKSTGRIDGVYALINALALNLSLRGTEATPGVMFV